jgi:transposase
LSDQQIRDLLAHSPFDLGYLSSGWTAELLCQYIREHHGFLITQRTMRRRLGELEIRWKRPRYIFSEPDPHRAQKKGASSDA